MARKSLPSKDESHNGLSADEFQRQLLSWFQDRGLLADLQAHLRHQMIVALKDTSLNIHSAGTFHQAGSPKLQAINLLVAEFLLRQQCHYTLSVFTSEVPLLRNMPEFSTAVSNSTSRIEPGSHEDRFPGFHERDVSDILEALGFASNSDEIQMVNDLYERSQGESLLTCVIRSLPNTTRSHGKIASRPESPQPQNVAERDVALQNCSLFTEDVHSVIHQSNLRAEQIAQLHDAMKRIVENEAQAVKKSEETKYQQELIDRERRIQEAWKQRDEEILENQRKFEEKVNIERLKVTKELHQKQAQFAVLATQLKEQQRDVASRLNYIQERSDILERKEVEQKVFRKESEETLSKKQEELEGKEKKIEEEHLRLQAEIKAREQERKELESTRIQIDAASRAIKESQAEIALLRDLQRQHSSQDKIPSSSGETVVQKKKSDVSVKKKKIEFSSQGVQADLIKQRGAVPKKHNVHQQTPQVAHDTQSLQTCISGTDLDEVFLQLRQQGAENEQHRSQHEMIGNLVDQLQQENLELRGHIEQQRLRIQELTAQSAELMHRLSSAHTTITRLRTEPARPDHDHHGVQTSPRSSSDTQAVPPPIPVRDSVPGLAVGAYGYQTPTPAPLQHRHVPEARPPTRGFVRSSQVGAGEESYFSRRLPPEAFVPLYSSPNYREQRKKPPRRFMVHSVSSSDDSCPSPTEDMLREARRRLRRLEDETAAIDRSYQEFRLRNADSLTNTASILFQPLPLSGDYTANYAMPAPETIPPRTLSPNAPMFSFPPAYSRSRLYAAHVGLLNQFQSTTVLQPGVLQPFPFFQLPRTNEQPRQNYSFSSNQAQSSPAVNPLYSVPSETFSTRPQNSLGGSVTTMTHGPPLSSIRVQNDIQNNAIPRGSVGNLRLPAGFNSREPSRYMGEREPFQRMDIHQQNKTNRWLQEPPPCTSSVPHIPIVTQLNENQKKFSITQSDNEKPLVFLHQDNQYTRTEHNTSEPEDVEHPSSSANFATLPPLELIEEVSPENVIDAPVYKRQMSSPQSTILPTEDKSKSLSNGTKSHYEVRRSDNAYSGIPRKMSDSELSASSSNLLYKSDVSKKEKTSPRDSSLEHLTTPHTNSTKNLPPDESIGDSIKSDENSCCQKKCPAKDEYINDVVQPGPSKVTSECPLDDVAKQNTNDNSRNSHDSKNSDSCRGVSQVADTKKPQSPVEIKERFQESTEIEEMKTTSQDSDKNSQTNNKNTSSGLPTKPISKDLQRNPSQDSSCANIEAPNAEVPAAIIDSHFERQSNSPSLPSTLGSSNELGSDLISAGEEKSEDSW